MNELGSRWISYQRSYHQFPRLLLSFSYEDTRVPRGIHHTNCQSKRLTSNQQNRLVANFLPLISGY